VAAEVGVPRRADPVGRAVAAHLHGAGEHVQDRAGLPDLQTEARTDGAHHARAVPDAERAATRLQAEIRGQRPALQRNDHVTIETRDACHRAGCQAGAHVAIES
jgi:hypothetical protein